MNFKKWVKSIQTAGYNGARTVIGYLNKEDPLQLFKKEFEIRSSKFVKTCKVIIGEKSKRPRKADF